MKIKGVMYVLECNVYIVYNDKKYFVILYMEICLCLLLIKCYYYFVVWMFVGFLVDVDNCEVSLRLFYKRSLKRSDNKLWRKKFCIKDVNIIVYLVLFRFYLRIKCRIKYVNKRKSWNLIILKCILFY